MWYLCKYLSQPGPAGPGTRGFHLMAELARRGVRVTVICAESGHALFGDRREGVNGRYSEQRLDGLQLIRVRTLKYRKQRSFRRIMSWLDFEYRVLRMPKAKLRRPDVIIASSLSLLTVLSGLLLSIRYRCKFVFEVRDIWPLTLVHEGGFAKWHPLIILLSWIEWVGYSRADAVVGTMPNLAEHVKSVVANSPPVYCVPMGFDDAHAAGKADVPEAVIQLPIGKVIVGYAGSMGVSNALETLLSCAAELVDEPRLHFVFMGEGDLRGDYVKRYGTLANISFAPTVARSDVLAFLEQCDILWFATKPSLVWRYGQSLNKLVDYMLAGRPIVGAMSGYESMLNEAQCGTFVPAGDVAALKAAVMRLANLSAEARITIGQRGCTWIRETRGYDKLGGEYLTILRTITDGAHAPRHPPSTNGVIE